jgi:Zn-dependent protease
MPISYWFLYLVILSASLALHEIGHWAEMTRQGIPMVRMTVGLGPSIKIFRRLHLGLFPIGASVSPDPRRWAEATPIARFRVALAGPVASFTCAAVLLSLGILYPQNAVGLSAFASLHFAIGALNLIPVPPMDGWHILTELMASYGKPLGARNANVALRMGNGLIYGFGFWYVGSLFTGHY